MRHYLSQGVSCATLPTPRPYILLAALLAPGTAMAASDAEIAELRSMLNQMKSQYESRIAALESRLAKAERDASTRTRESGPVVSRADKAAPTAEARPMSAPTAPGAVPLVASPPAAASGVALGALTSGSAFNPQISVFLDGNYYQDGVDGEGSVLVGAAYQPSRLLPHTHAGAAALESEAHAHGAAENGFNFREAELAFSATVDPYFDASLFISIDGDGGVELEEGWLQTRGLPYGLRIKAGKFLSDFGYINRQHPHQWDFVDQNLPYLNLLGPHGLQDTGVQLTWLPKLPFYTLVGAELAQGNQEILGATLDSVEQQELGLGDTGGGPRLWTAFAKVAPDLGDRHGLQLGISYAHNRQHQEVQPYLHGEEGHDHLAEDPELPEEVGLAGDAGLWGIDLVYKYAGGRAQGQGDFKFQTEYLRSIKDMEIRSSPNPEDLGLSPTFTTDGLYAQALYGFAPRWTAGLRYDVLGLTNEVSGGGEQASFGASNRWTLDLTWKLSEFSLLRAQYAKNDILVEPGERAHFDAFYLQFLVSMGSHGAHGF
jgi:hypothetical protein